MPSAICSPGWGLLRTALWLAALSGLTLVLAADARACVCADEPIEDRLDGADAAVVGSIVSTKQVSVRGAPQLLLTVEVAQRVKGDLPAEIVVRSPRGTDCDLPISRREPVGLLLTRAPDGALLASACSIVEPGPLVAAGGEPRGGVIKVAIGLVILGLVLAWSLRRLRRGARPDLPGAPKP